LVSMKRDISPFDIRLTVIAGKSSSGDELKE